MLMAGLDGIENRLDPGDPLDVNIYDLPPEQAKNVRQVPGSLDAALNALAADNDFLRKGDVFTEDVIDTWLEFKRTRELDPIRLRPHPWEFYLYFDV
jgi:glutamine synthetase